MTRTIFLDTETTGLDHRRHRIWDLAYIIRDPGQPDREVQTFIAQPGLDLNEADPFALNIGHFYARHPDPYGAAFEADNVMREYRAAMQFAADSRDAYIVGAVPWFDINFLTDLLHREHFAPAWKYHLVDVEALAAGALRAAPKWNFDTLLAAFGLSYAETDRHTAIGDARMARDLYDAVFRRDDV